VRGQTTSNKTIAEVISLLSSFVSAPTSLPCISFNPSDRVTVLQNLQIDVVGDCSDAIVRTEHRICLFPCQSNQTFDAVEFRIVMPS
jgi:hypothetical protein